MFEPNKKSNRIQNPKRHNNLDMETKKRFAIIGCVAAIILIILISTLLKGNRNLSDVKENKSKYIVYTKFSYQGSYKQEVPYLNMKADVFKKVNEDIDGFTKEYLKDENSLITYDYDISGIILSLVVKIVDNNTGYAPEVYFRTYNINMSNETVISDDSLLAFYGVNTKTVNAKIQNRFVDFYNGVIEKGYFVEDECDYECFLKYRDVSDYLEDIHYYVDDGKLVVFKPFVYYSIFGEENYFKDSDLEFEIADAPLTN